MKKYEDHILFGLASHIHKGAIKSPISNNVEDLNFNLIISPSVSPIYENNPAYTSITLETSPYNERSLAISDLHFNFFDLTAYQMWKANRWMKKDVMAELGVDLNSSDSIRDLY